MQWLFDLLVSLIGTITSLGVSFWNALKAALERYWWLLVVAMLGIIMPIIYFAHDMFSWFCYMIGTGMFDHILSAEATSAVLTGLALCNYVFPLVEVTLLSIGYLSVLCVMTLYRHIKSMVPSPLPGGGGT